MTAVLGPQGLAMPMLMHQEMSLLTRVGVDDGNK